MIIIACLAFSVAIAEEGIAQPIPLKEIRAACLEYLAAFATGKEVQAMEKRLAMQVETKVADSGMDEDRAMREIMLDWAAGNSQKLEQGDRQTMVQACFYFAKFIQKGYDVPNQIRSRLTPDESQKFISWLKSEAQKAKH